MKPLHEATIVIVISENNFNHIATIQIEKKSLCAVFAVRKELGLERLAFGILNNTHHHLSRFFII